MHVAILGGDVEIAKNRDARVRRQLALEPCRERFEPAQLVGIFVGAHALSVGNVDAHRRIRRNRRRSPLGSSVPGAFRGRSTRNGGARRPRSCSALPSECCSTPPGETASGKWRPALGFAGQASGNSPRASERGGGAPSEFTLQVRFHARGALLTEWALHPASRARGAFGSCAGEMRRRGRGGGAGAKPGAPGRLGRRVRDSRRYRERNAKCRFVPQSVLAITSPGTRSSPVRSQRIAVGGVDRHSYRRTDAGFESRLRRIARSRRVAGIEGDGIAPPAICVAWKVASRRCRRHMLCFTSLGVGGGASEKWTLPSCRPTGQVDCACAPHGERAGASAGRCFMFLR